ncbi:circadian clock protein KaiB [Oscillatoria sp. FACHB-1407]|uniref:circadian clock KaiB family protein n=1 Tax=Oscillatoria sp. FACHB-1407 TaxID=2692847 RepID=UPI0016821F9B|nr:circadian clock KaiB family protein [Oscillatoria sp. FACHB-1407]MBD2462553.1 circadian clock protein KaiB [Oscillatoria sp. FACHB-1407]
MADSSLLSHSTNIFKGIALFTPGGDLVYCIDPHKRDRWHVQLCATLQEMLGLSELPHFLSPFYAATIDRWLNPKTQHIETYAEASPLVLRYQGLLNAVFGLEDVIWKPIPGLEDLCDPIVMSTYQTQFPQLWETHDLVVQLDQAKINSAQAQLKSSQLSWSPMPPAPTAQGYVLRLYVSGNNTATERILQNLHHLLERSLKHPYTLKVVDIYKHPDLAENDQIAATPTLVKVYPPPVRRIVGDLEDVAKILQILASPIENF